MTRACRKIKVLRDGAVEQPRNLEGEQVHKPFLCPPEAVKESLGHSKWDKKEDWSSFQTTTICQTQESVPLRCPKVLGKWRFWWVWWPYSFWSSEWRKPAENLPFSKNNRVTLKHVWWTAGNTFSQHCVQNDISEFDIDITNVDGLAQWVLEWQQNHSAAPWFELQEELQKTLQIDGIGS